MSIAVGDSHYEHILDRDIVGRFLTAEARFRATLITDAFLGLSYHGSAEPRRRCHPVFRLCLHHKGKHDP